MADAEINFHVAGKIVGTIESSLESFDAEKHIIPKRIINKIRNTRSDFIELSINIKHGESDNGGK